MRVLLQIALCCVFAGGAMAQRGGMGGGGFRGGGGGGIGRIGGGGGRVGVGIGGGMGRGGAIGVGRYGGGVGVGRYGGGVGYGRYGNVGPGRFGGGYYRGGFGGYGRYGYSRYRGFYGGYWPYYGYYPAFGFGLGYWPSYWDYGYDPYDYYPYGYSGYYDPYAYSTPAAYQPNVTVVYPAQSQSSTVYSQPARPLMREYDQYGQEVKPSGPSADSSPIYLIAFKDQVIRAAVSYSIDGDTLNYVTLQHEQRRAPLSTIDRSLSQQLNRERGVQLRLP